ncbi:MAG TPA: M15 family metallopeptidase [Baekduia sp.]|uniref:M15 family metallopeptidase n=1 Tax=Baekduia sp. TaxID=2600305 RepID=UPI002D767E9F|nr:M15 family metallopeptidase [Baekduia sp.]HET6507494.1 M15 family metallopeptidase [Baekduia sp.]
MYDEPVRAGRPIRVRRLRVTVLVLALAALAVALAGGHWRSSSSPASALIDHVSRARHHGALGVAEGAVPDGTTVFDDRVAGVARLDPKLRAALRRAGADAAHDGVTFLVDSGWRSKAYQQHLFQQAVEKYGSTEEASRWVATPGTSAHVSGDAVDLRPGPATAWLSAHGAAYGLCQIYDNESWHYELRPAAVGAGCPPRYADAAHRERP